MTTTIIITFCSLLLIAYMFDLSSVKTKIPSVILLLLLGWVLRQVAGFLDLHLPDFSEILPVFGTIGLILIVLEGSLEVELDKSKFILITKSFLGALLPLIAFAFILSIFILDNEYPLKVRLINALPFCVISSAIAIPTVRILKRSYREFVIYESSLSDIIGLLWFDFLTLNSTIGFNAYWHFGFQMLIMVVVSFLATVSLSILLGKIEHEIKFIPIILLVILIYAISKIYHLPSLVFIILFGLFIGNVNKLNRFTWIERFRPQVLNKEIQKFKAITHEMVFLVRALFFLLFGFMIETSEILDAKQGWVAVQIVVLIIALRAIQLKLSRIPLRPLLFVAPRGLITILLFISIKPEDVLPSVNTSLLIQVIVLTALVMMFGMMFIKKSDRREPNSSNDSTAK